MIKGMAYEELLHSCHEQQQHRVARQSEVQAITAPSWQAVQCPHHLLPACRWPPEQQTAQSPALSAPHPAPAREHTARIQHVHLHVLKTAVAALAVAALHITKRNCKRTAWKTQQHCTSHLQQPCNDAAGSIMLVQRVRKLLPRAIKRLLQGVRLQHERIPLLQCGHVTCNSIPRCAVPAFTNDAKPGVHRQCTP